MRPNRDTLRRPVLAAILTLAVACSAPEYSGEGAEGEAEPMAAEVHELPPAPVADPADVASVDAIVTAVYESISGDAGVPRDWDRFRSLFTPNARLMQVATEHLENGRRNSVGNVSPAEFAEGAEGFFETDGFHEVEIGNVTETYGDIAHRFSSYASFRTDDPNEEPFNRGINSFQLLHDGERWWILSIFWQHEPDAGPIPERYLDG